ncbi:unnamed protein product [Echinostoma caproni]|uniref:SET domain-containing protein n=1 Tax=Echinostoma caproni TaxID=27848 RepID=A0A183AXT1_9TREM|nr:unnamed protein product [Echinostoma caproni]
MWPGQDCVDEGVQALLAYQCVASTPPWVIRELAQSRRISGTGATSEQFHRSPLFAFSGQRDLPPKELDPSHYRSIAWLETNAKKRTPHDLWQRTVAAVFLTHCLSDGGYPLDWSPDEYLRDPTNYDSLTPNARLPASWAAACILYHLQSLPLNAFSRGVLPIIPELILSRFQFNPEEYVVRGELKLIHTSNAIYPTLSLLNHSCDPNCMRISMRDEHCGLFAIEQIGKGSVLEISYNNAEYTILPRTIRHPLLTMKHQFQCCCLACKENWSLPDFNYDLICSHCHGAIPIKEPASDRNRELDKCCCPRGEQCHVILEFYSFLQNLAYPDMDAQMLECLLLFKKQIPQDWLDTQINKLADLLSPNRLGGSVTRSSLPLVKMKERLTLLLYLRYGWCLENIQNMTKEVFQAMEDSKLFV